MDHSTDTPVHQDGHDAPLDLAKTVRSYLKVGGVLILGTFLTVAVAYVPWMQTGVHWADTTIGLLIATIKVSFVGLLFIAFFFFGLKYTRAYL